MHFNWKRYSIGALLFAACLPLVLAGCGDYAGKGGAAGSVGQSVVISGKAVAGPINNATVQVFKLLPGGQKGDPIGEPVKTNFDGSYTLNFSNPGVPVVVVVSGSPESTYTDEYGNTVPFGANESIRTVVPDVTATADKPMTVQVTPVTELAAQLVQSNMGTTLSSDIKAAVQAANITIGKKIGVDNIVELQPAVVNDASSVKNSTPEQINYGLVLAGLAKLQQDAQVSQPGKPISEVISAVLDTPEKTATLAAAIVDFTRTSSTNATEIKDIPPALSQTIANAPTVQPPAIAVQQDTQAPAAPASLSASSDKIARVELSWSASTDNDKVDGYFVYRDGQNIGKASGTTFTDNRVEPGRGYKYQVKAVDAAGNVSAAGNEVSGATPLPPAAPAAAKPLTEPGALAAVAVSNNSVRFTWNASAEGVGGVAGYNVYRDGKVVATLAADSTTYTDSSLAGFTQYRYKIEAFDAAGNRKTSSDLAVTTKADPPTVFSDTTPPTAPSGLASTGVTYSRVALAWAASTDNVGVAGYKVYRNGQELATVQGTSYSDVTVLPRSSFSYHVIAYDAAGNLSSTSNSVSVPTPADPTRATVTLAAPTNLAVAGVTSGTVALTWSAPTGNVIAGYTIKRGADIIGTTQQPNFSDAAVQPNITYVYTVTAYDLAGSNAEASSPLSVITPAAPDLRDTTAPTAPTGLNAASLGSSQVSLSWTESTDSVGVTGYEIIRATIINGQPGADQVIAKVSAQTTAYGDSSVASGTTYQYKVRALDAAGNISEGSASNQIATAAATGDTVAPNGPTGLALAASPTATTVELTWGAATDNIEVVGYEVFRAGVKIATVTATAYADTTATPSNTYSYTVKSFDAAGNRSAASAALSATTPAPPASGDLIAPSAPSDLVATSLITASTVEVALTWSVSTDNTGGTGVAGYEIFRDNVRIATVATPGYTDRSVERFRTYSYTIKAVDGAGNISSASNAQTVVTGVLDTTPPSVPAGLKATSAGGNWISLAWDPSTDNAGGTGVTGYKIFRDNVLIGTSTQPAFTDTANIGIEKNGTTVTYVKKTYSYTVTAFDVVKNESATSVPLSVTTSGNGSVSIGGQLSPGIIALPIPDTTTPSAPAGLVATTFATSADTSTVVLSWNPSTDNVAVAGYEVYRGTSKIATVTQPGCTITNVVSGVTSGYYVIAYDAAGNRSAASNQLSVTPNQATLGVTVSGQLGSGVLGLPGMDISAPSAPTGLIATTMATSATTSSVILTWSAATDNSGVAGYEVYRGNTRIALISQPGYTDVNVATSGTYNYYVIAYDAAGNRSVAGNQLTVKPNQVTFGVTLSGALSSAILGLPGMDISAPTAPVNLSAVTFATSADKSSVVLTWNASTDNTAVAGYKVYSGNTIIATVTQPGYTDTNRTSGAAYTYYVVAFDAVGNPSVASNQLSVTPNQVTLGVTLSGQLGSGILGLPAMDISAPTAPANLSATASAVSADKSSVRLTWSASTDNTGVAGYEIYRGITKIATATQREYTDSNLSSGAVYNYFVIAYDAAGNRSVASTQLSVTLNPAMLGVTVGGQIAEAILGL
ncbi:MAG: Ig-like domain repeat protein [Deltaproteobacteria bacterium]|nr:Ig-like domain repeat protein [Deltaproteobacteria bacterium]